MGRFGELFTSLESVDFQSGCKKRVGSYVLGRTIGEGSFAKVRLGLHLPTKEKVAVKVVDKRVVMRREYARRNLHREASMLQRLQHPHIIQLLEVMETDSYYYIVTELADGTDFMTYISERFSIEEEEARRFMRHIVSAVDHIHNTGVVHRYFRVTGTSKEEENRDLKIENLMLDKDMNVKIIDFGLSAAWDGHTPLETQCGSPAYAAPEIFCKKPYGPAVDLWSIGVNLYAMLTGSLPFTADPPNNLNKLHAAILRGCDPPSNISKECQDVLVGLMEPDETKRMTMADLRRHPWITKDGTPVGPARLKSRPATADLDVEVINHMVKKLDMNEAQIRDSILTCRVNAMSATYQLLCKRKLNGFGSPGMPGVFLSTDGQSKEGELGAVTGSQCNELKTSTTSKVQSELDRPVSNSHSRIHLELENIPLNGRTHIGSSRAFQQHDIGLNTERILQRKPMLPTNIRTKRPDVLQGGCSNGDQHGLRIGTKSDIPPNDLKHSLHGAETRTHPNISSPVERADSTALEGLKKLKLNKEGSLRKAAEIDSYKDCLKQLRLQRGKPSRGILKFEASKEMPCIAPQHLGDRSVSRAQSNIASPEIFVHSEPDTPEKEHFTEVGRGRSTSASTKSVRFNLDHQSQSDETSTVSSLRSYGQPAQVERLVVRRLGADKIRKDTSLSMNMQHHLGNSNYAPLSNQSKERMRAVQQMRCSASEKMPPTPPNSALGRHRVVEQGTSPRRLSTPENSGTERVKPFVHVPKVPIDCQYMNPGSVASYRPPECKDQTEEPCYNRYCLKVRNDQGMQVLFWDLNVLSRPTSGENRLSDPGARGTILNDKHMRKLVALRGQVTNKAKSKDLAELGKMTDYYQIGDHNSTLGLFRRPLTSNQNETAPPTFRVRLHQERRSTKEKEGAPALTAIQDQHATVLVGSTESNVTE